MNKYALCWTGYTLRPNQEKCIASLAANKQYDTFAYIDNCGDKNETDKVVSLFTKYFPDANITIRPVNYGISLNTLVGYNEIFSKGYDGLFICENDIYCDSNAFETLENLAEWAKTNVPEAVVFSSWNYNLKREDYQQQHDFYFHNHGLERLNYNDSCTFDENEVGYTGQNHWGALITRRAWEIIGPYVNRHFQSYIDAKEISMKAFNFKNFMELMSKLQYVDTISNELKHRIISRFDIAGIEAIYDLALIAHGLQRVALTNPRSMAIEENGNDFKGNAYKMLGLDKIRTINSPNIPTEFILNKRSKELFMK